MSLPKLMIIITFFLKWWGDIDGGDFAVGRFDQVPVPPLVVLYSNFFFRTHLAPVHAHIHTIIILKVK